MNTLDKTILAVATLSVLVCYLLSIILTSLDSIKAAFNPTTAKATVIGGPTRSPEEGREKRL